MSSALKTSQRYINNSKTGEFTDAKIIGNPTGSKRNIPQNQGQSIADVRSKRLIESTVNSAKPAVPPGRVLDKQPSSILSSAQTKIKAAQNFNQKHLDRGVSGIAEYNAKTVDRGPGGPGLYRAPTTTGQGLYSQTGGREDAGKQSPSKSPTQKPRALAGPQTTSKGATTTNMVQISRANTQIVQTVSTSENTKILRKKTGLDDERMNLSIIRSISPIPGDVTVPVKVVQKTKTTVNMQRVSPTKSQRKVTKGGT